MGKPGGGRNDVDPRFISLFNVYNITFPSEESLFLIFDSILSGHTKPFSADIRDVVNIISKITLQLYKSIIVELPPTPSKFHYIFNLRDLSRIYNGLVLTTPERFQNVNQMIRVWRNEALRIVSDRLIAEEDKVMKLFSSFPDLLKQRKQVWLWLNNLFVQVMCSEVATLSVTKKFNISNFTNNIE